MNSLARQLSLPGIAYLGTKLLSIPGRIYGVTAQRKAVSQPVWTTAEAIGLGEGTVYFTLVQSAGKVHGPRRMLQKYFTSNFDPLSSGIDPN